MKSIVLFITSVFFIAAVTGQDGVTAAQQKCLTDAGVTTQSGPKCEDVPGLLKCLLKVTYDKRPDADEANRIKNSVTDDESLRNCNFNLDSILDELYNGASRPTVAAALYAMIAILTYFLARAV